MTTPQPSLSSLVSVPQYGNERQHVFPSKTSMSWFIRQHRSELINRGALLMISGRWFVEPAAFDAYVLETGKRTAAAKNF